MTKIPTNKNNKAKAADQPALVETSETSKSVVFELETEAETKEQTNSYSENVDEKGRIIGVRGNLKN